MLSNPRIKHLLVLCVENHMQLLFNAFDLIRCSCCLIAPMGNCQTRGGVVRGKRDSGVPNETVFLIEGHLLIGCCVLIFSKSLHFVQWLLSFGNTKWLYCCSKGAWKYTTIWIFMTLEVGRVPGLTEAFGFTIS